MQLFTTGQICKLCNVSVSTVNKWFNSGELKGFRIPGSRHRRVPRERLIEFLRAHDFPLGDLDDRPCRKLLVVSNDSSLTEYLQRALSTQANIEVKTAPSVFDAGLEAETGWPDCVLVDFNLGEFAATRLCQRLRETNILANTSVVGLLPARDGGSLTVGTALHDSFRRPFDPALLAARLRTLLLALA